MFTSQGRSVVSSAGHPHGCHERALRSKLGLARPPMRCSQCRQDIAQHGWPMPDGRVACSKACACRLLGHRRRGDVVYCDECRGPTVPLDAAEKQAERARRRQQR